MKRKIATFMQPFQCVLQHDVTTRMHLGTGQHQMTTIMQPFQCDLQPQIQETHRTTHTGTTTRCRTQRRNRLNSKRSKPHPPHKRGTFHRRLKPLYTEKHKVSCSGFLPSTSPMQHSRSTIRFAATSIHPCSHYNAICKHRFQNALELRTHDEPRIAKHHQGTNRTPKRTDRTRRAHDVPFIAG